VYTVDLSQTGMTTRLSAGAGLLGLLPVESPEILASLEVQLTAFGQKGRD